MQEWGLTFYSNLGDIGYAHHLLIAIFVMGYLFVALESVTLLNKATAALLMAVACWLVQFNNPYFTVDENQSFLTEKLGEVCQVIFFLLGALTIVEVINAYKGFKILTDPIKVRSKKKFLWIIVAMTFALSAVLDNLTTTIVMVSLMTKLVHEHEERLLFGAAVVIAANAGGAWMPIGDVTTTMLWIGKQISAFRTIRDLFLPSFACAAVATFLLSIPLKGNLKDKELDTPEEQMEPMGRLVFFLGLGLLVFVPIFKVITHLPPFLGVFFGLGVLWFVTDFAHRKKNDRDHLKVPHVLSKVDLSSVLFFLGILLSVAALEGSGLLGHLEKLLSSYVTSINGIAMIMGITSAIIDNVPLVAACQAMYSLSAYPQDSELWQLIAYASGTGGSLLVIGSSAGVAYMGMVNANFIWWCRKITLPALVGYVTGIFVYALQQYLFRSIYF